MKQYIITSAIFICSICGIFAQNEMVFANEQQAFEISYKQPWKLSDMIMDETAFAVYLPSTKKNEPNETINIKTYYSQVNELQTCASATLNLIKERYSDLVVDKWEEVELDAGKAYTFSYHFSVCKDNKCKKRMTIYAKSYILVKDFKVYFMTLTSMPNNLEKNEKEFDKMVQSFHLVLKVNI